MGEFVTPEAARELFRELADQVDAAYDEMRTLASDGVGNEFRTELAERLEFPGANQPWPDVSGVRGDGRPAR